LAGNPGVNPEEQGEMRPAEAGGRTMKPPKQAAPQTQPIDPDLCYPWPSLRDFRFGSRSIADLKDAGLEELKFGKLKFFMGRSLIAVLAGKTTEGPPQ
jgi:hypothetical protein